ncbi:hypothetical protein LXA43DRAFT_890172 [Ganoderma leucocontextum]|nr:hypothetical protein LXA43DRAFT_890172 [Ganoderma leucocontextum]
MARRRLHVLCKVRQCKVLVPCAPALPFPRGGRLPFYCPSHLRNRLAKQTMRSRKQRTCAIRFKDFIPANLEARTQVLLRQYMRDSPGASDRAGYIYALRLVDKTNPHLVRIKVGGSVDVAVRFSQHRRRCPSSHPVLLGSYPSRSTVPFANLLERLVHLELTDLAARSYPAGRTAPRPRCRDCGSTHVEIFTFKRVPGLPYNYEWEHIIRPVFKRWAQFVSNHVV